MNEGKLISRLIVLFTLIIGGFLYAANNPHKSFSLDKFGEDAQYNQKLAVDLADSVVKNRELLNKLSDQIKDISSALERLNSDQRLATDSLRDEFIASSNLLLAQKARSDFHQEAINDLYAQVEINKNRNALQESSLDAASNLISNIGDKIDAFADKIDLNAATVTNLETNYRATLDAL